MSEEGPIKGVMLPQRPPDSSGGGQVGGVFRPSGVPSEPWGMCPVHKVSMSEVTPKPPGINAAHKKWVRQLEGDLAAQKLDGHLRVVQEAAKQKSVGDFSAKLRAAILSEEDTGFWRAARKPAIKTTSPTHKGAPATTNKDSRPPAETNSPAPPKGADDTISPSPKEHSALDDLEGFVNSVYEEAAAAKSMSTSHRAADGPASKGVHEWGQGRRGGGAGDRATGKLDGGEAQATGEKPSASSGHGGSGEGGAENEGSQGRGEPGAGEQAKASSSAAAGQDRPGSAQSQAKSVKAKGKPSNKPAWALSQAEVQKKETSEEDELLAFTEQLDFDAYIDQLDDVELKDAFQELQDIDKKGGDEKAWQKSFVRACNHAAMRHVQKEKRPANSDDEGDDNCAQSIGSRSIAPTRLRAKNALREALEQKQGQWDASTRAGDDVARMEQASKATAAAEEFLIENPEMKAVHSNASVRALMDKASVAEQQQKQQGPIKAN
ncbi:hypothetical protein DUNSADRAFT_9947 [Dunaliella salina]|uniref:Uncharacterized protein n=1 Tax=Dunaliella salina TaxID=3046 RepID=A0ABQ7GGD5_DUNSA|nr:hypothetical protein DUNSADRAFT_9947 [Dunaliella salina]|eukprot:KAF5833676.1 hypothetical protein DUNSADRAFT_9947 [Dunaliella salina]